MAGAALDPAVERGIFAGHDVVTALLVFVGDHRRAVLQDALFDLVALSLFVRVKARKLVRARQRNRAVIANGVVVYRRRVQGGDIGVLRLRRGAAAGEIIARHRVVAPAEPDGIRVRVHTGAVGGIVGVRRERTLREVRCVRLREVCRVPIHDPFFHGVCFQGRVGRECPAQAAVQLVLHRGDVTGGPAVIACGQITEIHAGLTVGVGGLRHPSAVFIREVGIHAVLHVGVDFHVFVRRGNSRRGRKQAGAERERHQQCGRCQQQRQQSFGRFFHG